MATRHPGAHHTAHHLSLADAYATLMVPIGSPAGEVRTAYRRLMKCYHPDRYAGDPAVAHQHFVQVARAYKRIRTALVAMEDSFQAACCPGCAEPAELFEGLDGGSRCARCLLGEHRRSRLLPAPSIEMVRHTAVILLESCAGFSLVHALVTASTILVWPGLLCAVAATLLLATTCTRIASTA